MERIKLLIVEDEESDLQAFRDSVEVYKDKEDCEIEFVECKTLHEVSEKLNNSYDGIIIDLKLEKSGTDGNEVMQQIRNSRFRIPIIITTGTPGAAAEDFIILGVYKKGEYQYKEILDQFRNIVKTGLTRIMGGRGEFEKVLYEVFQKNLLPNRDFWIKKSDEEQEKTESALLRYTLNHLNHALDRNDDEYFPEEVYISPPLHENLETGSIIQNKAEGIDYILLTPACDLVIRSNGSHKTDRLLLIEIESHNDIQRDVLKDIQKTEKKKTKLRELMKNNSTMYYHWLPGTDFFNGGYINFRKSHSITKGTLDDDFHLPPKISVSPAFVKDIVSRYSSYYARQGQPDISKELIISRILDTE